MMHQPRWIGIAVLLGGLGGGLLVTVMAHRPARAFTGTLPVGFGPQQVALDRRTGYAFVTNGDDHTVSLLDSRRGVVRRTIAVTGAPLDVAVDTSTRRAFVVTGAGTLQVLDTESGALLRHVTIGVGVLSLCALAVDEHLGRVVITMGTGDKPSILTILDARTGIILRQMTVGRYAHSVAVDERSGRAVVTNSNDTTVTLVDLGRARVLRTVVLPWHPLAVAIDALTGHAFVTGPAAGAVAMLDDDSGAVLRLIATQAGAQEVAAAGGRAVVITGNGGTATGAAVLDARTGRVLHAVSVGATPDAAHGDNPRDVAVDPRGDHAFVIDAPVYQHSATSGSIGVIDAHSGRLLRRLRAGQAPVALALDEGTGHLLVVNAAGGAVGDTATGAAITETWGWVPPPVRPWLPWLSHPVSTPSPGTGSVSVLDGVLM